MAQTTKPSAKATFRAMAAKVETPTAGLSTEKARPLAAATPMRMPVKDPGLPPRQWHPYPPASCPYFSEYAPQWASGCGCGSARCPDTRRPKSARFRKRRRKRPWRRFPVLRSSWEVHSFYGDAPAGVPLPGDADPDGVLRQGVGHVFTPFHGAHAAPGQVIFPADVEQVVGAV